MLDGCMTVVDQSLLQRAFSQAKAQAEEAACLAQIADLQVHTLGRQGHGIQRHLCCTNVIVRMLLWMGVLRCVVLK